MENLETERTEALKNLPETGSLQEKILKQSDLYEILPFKRGKVLQLLRSGQLPVLKVGKDYITTFSLIEKWIAENIGREIYF